MNSQWVRIEKPLAMIGEHPAVIAHPPPPYIWGPDSGYHIRDSSYHPCYSRYHLFDSSYPPVITVNPQLLTV